MIIHVCANSLRKKLYQTRKILICDIWNAVCHVTCLISSIFVAFILEAFFVEYSIEKSEVETAIEKKIQELGIGVQE